MKILGHFTIFLTNKGTILSKLNIKTGIIDDIQVCGGNYPQYAWFRDELTE